MERMTIKLKKVPFSIYLSIISLFYKSFEALGEGSYNFINYLKSFQSISFFRF